MGLFDSDDASGDDGLSPPAEETSGLGLLGGGLLAVIFGAILLAVVGNATKGISKGTVTAQPAGTPDALANALPTPVGVAQLPAQQAGRTTV